MVHFLNANVGQTIMQINGRGSEVSDQRVLSFVTDNFNDHCNFVGDVFMCIHPMNESLLESWDEIENWLGIFGFDFTDVDYPEIDALCDVDIDDLNPPTPSHFFQV